MASTKSKKKPLTMIQRERKELAQVTKEYNRKRILIKEKFKLKHIFGDVHILVFDCQKKIHISFQNDNFYYNYRNNIPPTKEMVTKLLELFPPIELYFCPTKGNKGFYHEGSKALTDGRVIEEIYPILVKTSSNNSNTTITWESKTHNISIEFSNTSFYKLISKPSSSYGMNAINYQGGYSTSYWPLQSEFDIMEYIND